jgi:septal ring factor EnvC (AmiA/AmiB activator)
MILAIESFSTLYALTRSELETTYKRLQESEQEREDLRAHIERLSNLLEDCEKRRQVHNTNSRKRSSSLIFVVNIVVE